MRLELSRFVEGDLDAIAEYIAKDNPARALTFLREIGKKIDRVGKSPLTYQLRPEIGEGARVAALGNYLILFRVVAEKVRIERVVHGSRDLTVLFGRKT
jgi:toxin ParE1/3/4